MRCADTLVPRRAADTVDDTQMELKAKGKSVDDLLTEIQDYASILERKENIPDYEMPKLPDNV